MTDTCPTCTRPASAPYRVYDDRGRVINGCVDAHHDGALVTPSESARWHARPEARIIRRASEHGRAHGYACQCARFRPSRTAR
jgi:hypothetical protein